MAAEASRETLADTAVVDMSTSPTVTVGRLPLTEDKDGGMNFNSVKLAINTPSPSQRMDDVEFRGAGSAGSAGGSAVGSEGLRRDRQFNASVMSRRSTTSTKSRVSLSPHIFTTELAANGLFSYRTTAIEKAVEACKKSIINQIDGEVTGYWLLTEIDHWDMEKERLVILTTKSLLVVKYDFIALLARECKRVLLSIIDHVEIGDFFYPQYSVMPSREHGGFRIRWAKDQPSWAQRWNPWCSDIGYVTFTHHLLAYTPTEKETTTFDVGDLADSVTAAVKVARQADGRNEPLTVQERPIVIESYASINSLVFNQSHLGFNMERGGVSF